MLRIFTVLFSSVLLAATTYAADSISGDKAPSGAGEGLVIGNVMSSGAEEHFTVVVDKIPRKLYLLKTSGDTHEIMDTTAVLIGENDGHKEVEGDKRTPEGIYYIVSYMSDAEMLKKFGAYAEIYGVGAYPTNYPNPIDRILNRTGHGIWLHGLNPGRHKPATEGCVGVQNDDLNRMKPNLSIGVPVVIVDNILFMTSEQYANEKNQLMGVLTGFIDAWNKGDAEAFAAFIHPKYSSYAAKNANAYIASKKYLMDVYPEKLISIDNVNIYRQNDKTLVYDMNQFYCAPNVTTYSNKRYYMLNDNGKFRMISEEISPKPVRDYLNSHINDFVKNWQNAWQSKNIDEYAKYYSTAFTGRPGWKDSKEKLFNGTSQINVGIRDLKWENTAGDTIKITFIQDYQSDTLKDSGLKTLVLKGCPGSYKIQSEDWAPINLKNDRGTN